MEHIVIMEECYIRVQKKLPLFKKITKVITKRFRRSA